MAVLIKKPAENCSIKIAFKATSAFERNDKGAS